MCSGNDSGKFVMQKTLWCDFIWAEHFHTWNSLPVNDGVLRPHSCRKRVKRVQEWVGIHHEDYTFQPGRSRTCEHSTSVGTGFGKPSRQFKICPLHWFICENCTHHCPCTTGIQHCLCMVGTKIHDGSSQKLMFGDALSLLQSFKGGASGFPESMVTLWDIFFFFFFL